MVRRLLLAVAIAALAAVPAFATDPKEEQAETVDGVKLRCRFYPAAGEGNGSCVILMHDYGADPDSKATDWDGVARFLSDKVGMHVMRFDFRGHGKSTDIIPDKFWETIPNQKLITYNKRPPRTTIDFKDFRSDYYNNLVNDLAAVRFALDLKNDGGSVNTRSVYLMASGSAAPLALLFLATEWNRPQVKPERIGFGAVPQDVVSLGTVRRGNEVAGKDYAGLILLTPTLTYNYEQGTSKGVRTIQTQTVKDWVKYCRDSNLGGDLRSNISTLILAGEKDVNGDKTKDGVASANLFYHDILAVEGKTSPKLPAMKNSPKVQLLKGAAEKGAALLGKNATLKTEDFIESFIKKIESDRKKLNPITRKFDKPYRINMNSFGAAN